MNDDEFITFGLRLLTYMLIGTAGLTVLGMFVLGWLGVFG